MVGRGNPCCYVTADGLLRSSQGRGGGVLTGRGRNAYSPSLRGAAFSHEELATWWAVAISAVVRPPMDCFVHRNDGAERNDRARAPC